MRVTTLLFAALALALVIGITSAASAQQRPGRPGASKGETPKAYHARRSKELAPDDKWGHLELADICNSTGLKAQRDAHAKIVLGLAPRNVRAHELLGHVRSKGKWITTRQLATLLKPFKIKSKVERRLGSKRGYMTDAFKDSFKRYLPVTAKDIPSPPDPPSVCVTPLQPLHSNSSSDFPSVTTGDHVTQEKTPKPAPALSCNTVTDRKGVIVKAPQLVLDREKRTRVRNRSRYL